MRTTGIVAGVVLLFVAVLSVGMAQDEVATYVKGAMCIACHKGLNKELVERFQATKHYKVGQKDDNGEPPKLAEMKPAEIYRRSVGFNPEDNSFVDPGVGCQSCHGAGSLHLKAKGDEEKRATMKRPDKLDTPHKKLSVCGRCHGQYTIGDKPFAADYKFGDDLFAIEGFKLTEVTQPGPFQQLNEFMASKHGEKDVTCVTCHTAHETTEAKPQLRKPVPDLCLQCHAQEHKCTVAADKVKAGDTCATCHMAGGRHTFKAQ